MSRGVTEVQTVTVESGRVEEEDAGNDVDVLADAVDVYDDDEVEGEQGDGTVIGAKAVETLQQSQENPMNGSREELIKAIADDHSLTSIKELAEKEANGYRWEEGLLLKYQLDQFGKSTKRLCVPQKFREKCMVLAHNKFGHRCKNKVAQDLARLFYWPSLWRDVATHCRACKNCQEYSKAKPRHSPMVEREVITVPSERVAINLVGPLPKARRGCEYICCHEVA